MRLLLPPLLLLAASGSPCSGAHAEAGPDSVAAILGRISPPEIPARDFIVPKSSAAEANAAINAAIDQAHNAGGGRVVLSAGTWLSAGPVEFKSDVELHLKTGATLRFSTNASDCASPHTLTAAPYSIPRQACELPSIALPSSCWHLRRQALATTD